MTCEFFHDAGAYVLGALSPSERLAFERHLSTCDECARSVRELAGLPGLLGRIPAEMLEHPATPEPLPDTLLPRLARAARRDQRRRTWATAGLSAAAALIVTAGVAVASGGLDGGSPADVARPTPSGSATVGVGQAMVPLVNTPITANLAMLDVAWGTRLHLVCTYKVDGTPRPGSTSGAGATTGSGTTTGSEGSGGSAGGEWGAGEWGSGEGTGSPSGSAGEDEPREWIYSMVVVTRDGTEEQVATWNAVPGKTMRLDAATATSRDDIASVEVRTAAGRPLLELQS